MAYITAELVEGLPSPLAAHLLPLLEKSARNSDGLREAVLDVARPVYALNSLLERETYSMQRIALQIVNHMVEDIPRIFPTRESVRTFHNMIVRNMKESGNLKMFTEKELQLPFSVDDGMLVDEQNLESEEEFDASTPLNRGKHKDKLDECGNQIYLFADTDMVEGSLQDLTKSLPEALVFMKGAIIEIKGRAFSPVFGELRLRSGLQIM